MTLKKSCEQCRRRRRACNSQRPCSHCLEEDQHCVYSVIPDQSRTVFSTQAARRLSSGSACETCRRRKTKCDGGNPCSFCATNHIECVNHSERRHLAKYQQQQQKPAEAMDRIEDRLRRIERLMTAFTPSPLSITESHKMVRPHRHSVQGINVAKEQTEMQMMKRRGYSHRYGSLSPPPQANSTTYIAHSMHHLTISPSDSSSTDSPFPLTSASSPSMRMGAPLSPPVSSGKQTEDIHAANDQSLPEDWKQPSTMPSLMDQLSNRTFTTTAMHYSMKPFPIYPLTPPPSLPHRPNRHS
ncbi:uncharacterized protein B0P05DRAFT_529400 [Gilbertella persicaria]|uniref:uncharacterized protein n=1 Tax=Gilbertella persicaria TaxID=101096 RepID=UPI00222004C6|nr:uncharacterized protein B0P05DRAFT_529400 [Gilbertella persicaria]KAI8090114.1 hypothetical protein B0P05DRAFT_529400 [Gilbertella persicaria]